MYSINSNDRPETRDTRCRFGVGPLERQISGAASHHRNDACFRFVPCALFCLFLAILSPAHAWQATSGENCELSHETDSGRILVHFSPAARQYAIAITAVRRWAPGPVFAIRFDGPRGLTITTRRHALLGNGETVSVTDRGFGNVLNGLEFNDTATARLGDRSVTFALDGAAQAVREFRSCATDPRA